VFAVTRNQQHIFLSAFSMNLEVETSLLCEMLSFHTNVIYDNVGLLDFDDLIGVNVLQHMFISYILRWQH
jgi:hypothetical protein